MPRKLTTDFVKVATSGPTIDGRNIPSQDIVDMAETYDLEEYTANITYEHIRYFGNLGKVVEVKAEEDSKGRMSLYAKIAPTDDLVYMNTRGQKLFTSIEIQPDFAGTGKAYLAGLAVTDSPASLGTTELQFSRAQKPDNYFTKPIELTALELEESQGLIGRLLNSFGRETTQEPKPKGETSMDSKQFNSLKEMLEDVQSKIGEMEGKFSSAGNNAGGGEGGEDDSAPVSKKEFQALMDKVVDLGKQFKEGGDGENKVGEEEVGGANQSQFAELSEQLKDLTDKFNQALNTSKTGTKVPEGSGDAGTARVL